jgi:thioredoxin reductase (NADPH)
VDLTLVHRRETLRAQEYLANNLFATNIPILWDTVVTEIKGEKKVEEVVLLNKRSEETKTIPVDGVFIAIGYEPAVELATKIGVELTPDGYIKKDEHHRTNIPGIYSAGDVEGGFKQIVTAAGQGAGAAMSIFEDLINPYWKKQTEETVGKSS